MKTTAIGLPAASLVVKEHLRELRESLDHLEEAWPRLDRWADVLWRRLNTGSHLLAAGNGGSAALASHLTAELVGRYRRERRAFSACALVADLAALTAIGNDYGYERVFARQIEAHGGAGDIVMLLSTSGRSANLLRAADAARTKDCTVWAMTGACSNSLAEMADDWLGVGGTAPAAQEAHQVAVHLLCELFDQRALGDVAS